MKPYNSDRYTEIRVHVLYTQYDSDCAIIITITLMVGSSVRQ